MGRRNDVFWKTLLVIIEERTSFEVWPSTFELIAMTVDLPSNGVNGIIILPNAASKVRRALNRLAAEGRVVKTRAWRNHPARWCTPQAYAACRAQLKIGSAIKQRIKLADQHDSAIMTALAQGTK